MSCTWLNTKCMVNKIIEENIMEKSLKSTISKEKRKKQRGILHHSVSHTHKHRTLWSTRPVGI